MRESKRERGRVRIKDRNKKKTKFSATLRWPLIAPELREQGGSLDKGKKQGNIRDYADSNVTSPLGQPFALVSSRLPLPVRLYTSFPHPLLSPSSRGILWIHVEEKFIRKLDNAFGLWPRRLSSPLLASISLRRAFVKTHTYTHIHVRACKGVESVFNLAEKLADDVWRAAFDRDYELYLFY